MFSKAENVHCWGIVGIGKNCCLLCTGFDKSSAASFIPIDVGGVAAAVGPKICENNIFDRGVGIGGVDVTAAGTAVRLLGAGLELFATSEYEQCIHAGTELRSASGDELLSNAPVEALRCGKSQRCSRTCK